MSEEAIQALTARIKKAAPAIADLRPEIEALIADKTARLIASDDERTRGAIHVLLQILELPDSLQNELAQLITGLSNIPDPDFS